MIKTIPLSLKEANEYVLKHHRHHKPVHADKFRCGCINELGELIGVVQVGRPVSRILDDGFTLEVVRLCTNGDKNVCSYLYSKCARIAKELGYKKIITYILESENGNSLIASGWKFEKIIKGHSWNCKSRPRMTEAPTCDKKRFCKYLIEGGENNG